MPLYHAPWGEPDPAQAWGGVPGSPWVHRGIQVEGSTIRDLGMVWLPSIVPVCTWLWQHVFGAKHHVYPATYAVDAQQLSTSWEGYLTRLAAYLPTAKLPDWKAVARWLSVCRWKGHPPLFGWLGTKLFGWPHATKVAHPVLEADRLRARQWWGLDTPVVAYLSAQHAAIASDPSMRSRWELRRKQLLEHHGALATVDLESIPDPAYRQEVAKRQPAVVTVGPIIRTATISPLGLQAPAPPGSALPHPPKIGGATAVAGLAAAGAAGYAAWRWWPR